MRVHSTTAIKAPAFAACVAIAFLDGARPLFHFSECARVGNATFPSIGQRTYMGLTQRGAVGETFRFPSKLVADLGACRGGQLTSHLASGNLRAFPSRTNTALMERSAQATATLRGAASQALPEYLFARSAVAQTGPISAVKTRASVGHHEEATEALSDEIYCVRH